MVNRAIFLDRDGVINKPIVRNGKPYAPRKFDDFILLPDVELAINEMVRMGFLVFVVTNQPDIGNGLVEKNEINKMHELIRKLPINQIYMCPHSQTDLCNCRKPKPGMILRARDEHDLLLEKSYFIGDRKTDMEAAFNAGCLSVFIDYKYPETIDVEADYICNSIMQTLKYIKY